MFWIRLVISIALILLVDYYLFQAIRTSFKRFSPGSRKWISIVYWAIPVLFLITISIAFINSGKGTYPFLLAFIMLYLSKFAGIGVLFFEDIIRFFRLIYQKVKKIFVTAVPEETGGGEKITRSAFISQTALAVTGLHVGAFSWGIVSGAHDYRIHRVQLPLKNLPAAFDGLVIGQISDIHSGSFYKKVAVQGGVDLLMMNKPDMVFFTGDLVNNEAKELNEYFDIFKQIKAPLGVYSVTGNHDYGDYFNWGSEQEKKRNFESLISGHKELGWNLLMDEHRKIKIGNDVIGVLGIQNWGAGGFIKAGDLQKAMKDTDDLPVRLLLSHDPSHWREQVLSKTQIDAAFAGHTHGMQYGVELGAFRFSPAQLRYPEWAGLYTENEQHLYVNRGFGYLGYPGRVGILPELTLIELKKV